MCEWFDETVGELLGHLDKTGQAENTIVIYLHDNGWIQDPKSAVYAAKSKQSQYDGGVRTPILIRWPNRVKPGRSEALASSIDVVPTILAALEMKQETKLPGVNLLLPDAVNKREAVFGEIYEHNAVDIRNPVASLKYRWVIAGHCKLIVPNAARLPNAKLELYDLHADPTEVTNLADKDVEKAAKLRTLLDAWWKP